MTLPRYESLYLEEASTTKELQHKIEAIFAPKKFEGEWSEDMITLKKVIEEAPMIKDFSEFEKYIIEESGLKDKNLLKPLRILLTGSQNGPKLSDIYPLIKSYLLEITS